MAASPRNLADNLGHTPLHIAAARGRTNEVKLLLDAGAKVNAVTKDGSTPLHTAADHGYENVARTLLRAGAKVNALTKDGSTPLHRAAGSGFTGVSKVLLDAGAKVNAVTKNGSTPLHHAADTEYTGPVNMLLRAGAKLNATDKHGHTALHVAAGSGYENVARTLLRAGAKVNALTKDGSTPLNHAAAAGGTNVVQVLMRSGAKFGQPKFGQPKFGQPKFGVTKGTARLVHTLPKCPELQIEMYHGTNVDTPEQSQRVHQAIQDLRQCRWSQNISRNYMNYNNNTNSNNNNSKHLKNPNSLAFLFAFDTITKKCVAGASCSMDYQRKSFHVKYLCSSQTCKGAGSFLMNSIENYVRTHNFEKEVNSVSLYSTRNAAGFYPRIGFIPAVKNPNGYNVDRERAFMESGHYMKRVRSSLNYQPVLPLQKQKRQLST